MFFYREAFNMFKISFYTPASHLESVKNAMFAAGAGQIGHYDHCCWQTKGQGQYRPLVGSQAYQGKRYQLETCEEYLVEMICAPDKIHAVIKALKQAHPYETPAYAVWPLLEI